MPVCVQYGPAPLDLKGLDWLGFDLDHAVARYKTPALMRLVHDCLVHQLVHLKGYPPAALGLPHDYAATHGPDAQPGMGSAPSAYQPHFTAKGLIFDFEAGDLVKLDENGHVAM
jgi:hypothetical protein